MPGDFSDSAVFDVLPKVNLDEPTEATLKAEAATLGDRFTNVSAHPADLVADAVEMVEAKADIADMKERGYPVSDGLVVRIELLSKMIAPLMAEEERTTEWSKAKIDSAEKARKRLLKIRTSIAKIGKAAGLPAPLFSLQTKKTTRLNVVTMRMEEVLSNVSSVRSSLPDKVRVDQLVTEARQLLDEHGAVRMDARITAVDHRGRVRLRKRYERLLYDAMVYLSAQGLAAYEDDETREVRYRLDHVYGRKPSKVGDPGAGGVEGDPNAGGPLDYP